MEEALTVLGDQVGTLIDEELKDDDKENREIEGEVVAHLRRGAQYECLELA